MRVLDLFSGIGGFSLGLERAGMQTIAFCEIDPYCRRVLRKHWPGVPIFEDVRTLRGEDVGPVDLVCGGYPCQPFSTAGKRRGTADDRHLWPEMLRVIDETRPTWVCGENVAGLISMVERRDAPVVESRQGGRNANGVDYESVLVRQEHMLLNSICNDLGAIGYSVSVFVVPAVAVDAKHRRDRVWVVGHTEHGANAAERGQCQDIAGKGARRGRDGSRGDGDAQRQVADGRAGEDPGSLADTYKPGPQGHGGLRECAGEQPSGSERRSEPGRWLPEPGIRGMDDGLSKGLDGGLNAGQWMGSEGSSRELSEEKLREVWGKIASWSASQGSGSDEQCARKLADALPGLSHDHSLGNGENPMAAASTFLCRLRQACEAIRVVRNTSDPTAALWLSLSGEEADRTLMAACGRTHWEAGEWLGVPRIASGVPHRVDRLRALGNAVVPQIPEMIGRAIMAAA